MAIRSLLLALATTGVLGYCFTVGLTDPDSLLKKIPEWAGMVLFFGCAVLYIVAAWWAFKGFSDHKITAIISLMFCTFGLGIYATVLLMEFGPKTTPGQYDYSFSRLDPTEKAVLAQLTHDAGLTMTDAVFTEHWNMAKAKDSLTNGFQICVQKGHITGLMLSNHPVHQLALFSQLPQLDHLYLKNCGLSDMSELKSTEIERLDVSDNQITNLKTLLGCPNLGWLFIANNRLTSRDGLEQFKKVVSTDFSGNPMPQL
ncbi:hypothetical protein GCM10028805_31050 [Spirosoma harenae]